MGVFNNFAPPNIEEEAAIRQALINGINAEDEKEKEYDKEKKETKR